MKKLGEGGKYLTKRRTRDRITADFSSETMQRKEGGTKYFKC